MFKKLHLTLSHQNLLVVPLFVFGGGHTARQLLKDLQENDLLFFSSTFPKQVNHINTACSLKC